ncbi:MAG: hypothetical protein R2681_00240 [Pyrinomonadaceae bacterium]
MLHEKFELISKCVVTLFILILPAYGQNNECAELQKLIDQTYNFKPSQLTPEERTAKSAEMDVVWSKVRAEKEKLIPCLRKSVQKSDADSFFSFDASNLIFSLDKSDESKELLVKSYAKVDLKDVNLAFWLPTIAVLGYEGFDTTDAGESWLKSSVEGYYLPQHGTLKLTKDVGSLVIYGSMDEKFATPALAKIASDKDHPSRNLAVYLLLQQATPDAFQELKILQSKLIPTELKILIEKSLSDPKLIEPRVGEPKSTRDEYLNAFKELIDGKSSKFTQLTIKVSDGEKDAVVVLKKEDMPLIRKARRYFAATANPHSPEWYQSFTDILTTLLYKEPKIN